MFRRAVVLSAHARALGEAVLAVADAAGDRVLVEGLDEARVAGDVLVDELHEDPEAAGDGGLRVLAVRDLVADDERDALLAGDATERLDVGHGVDHVADEADHLRRTGTCHLDDERAVLDVDAAERERCAADGARDSHEGSLG